MRVTPCPSPNGTNLENLHLVKLPRGTSAGALDSALRRATDRRRPARDEDPDERAQELREKLVEIIDRHMDGDAAVAAMQAVEHCFGGRTADDEHEGPPDREGDRTRMRDFLEDRGCSDAEVAEVLAQMPRNAREGGMGGRLAELEGRRADDRRRGGVRDRRPAAMDSAEDTLEQMFGAARIGTALSFR